MRDRLNCRTISRNSWCRRVSAGSQLEDFEPESEKVQLLSDNQLREVFEPVFEDIRKRATVAEKFLDRDLYRVYIATLWSNVVLSPDEVGIEEEDIEPLHDILLSEIRNAIGPDNSMKELYQFISSKDGEKAMVEAKITQTHKDLLNYFSSMILDPEGHKRWMDYIRDQQK